MSSKRYTAITFDFDGVLVESVDVKTRAFAALYEPYGYGVVASVVAYHLAHGGVSRYEKFRYFHREFLGQELTLADEKRLGEHFSTLVEDAVVASPWVPGAFEFLNRYFGELRLYVASGTPEKELRRIIARRDMEHYFHGVYGSPRSKSEILAEIVDINGIDPAQMLMIGDAVTDYEGALSAGTDFVGRVPTGQVSHFPYGVTVVSDMNDLPSLI